MPGGRIAAGSAENRTAESNISTVGATEALPLPGRRVVVIGTSGSGKTTMARNLSAALGVPHVELDALHWEPNWVEAPDQVLRDRVQAALGDDGWVIDGNYSKVRDLLWPRADTVVWLDYSLPVIMSRLLRRTVRRSVTREEIWAGTGNREILARAFFSRDSILLWALQTYRKYRGEYSTLLALPEHAHLTVVHLTSPRQAHAWLRRVASAADCVEG